MSDPHPLVAGNWKMNGTAASAAEIRDLLQRLREAPAKCDVLICPPATLLMPFSLILEGYSVSIGAQDCHPDDQGAFTGDISAPMIRDAGCSYVIVGHSERRAMHGENSPLVRAKAKAAHRNGLASIICVGESEDERTGGRTIEAVATQLRESIPDGADAHNTVIAYEPVWAIGTGNTPTGEEIGEVHALIRKHLRGRFGDGGRDVRILYGGSVSAGNAKEISQVPNVNGALVGGASLRATDFDGILDAYR